MHWRCEDTELAEELIHSPFPGGDFCTINVLQTLAVLVYRVDGTRKEPMKIRTLLLVLLIVVGHDLFFQRRNYSCLRNLIIKT